MGQAYGTFVRELNTPIPPIPIPTTLPAPPVESTHLRTTCTPLAPAVVTTFPGESLPSSSGETAAVVDPVVVDGVGVMMMVREAIPRFHDLAYRYDEFIRAVENKEEKE